METLYELYGSGEAAAGGSGGDPIVDPEPLYRDRSHVVYAASHHAAEFLVGRYGEERVRAILSHMASGPAFPVAFERAIGISEGEFAAEFRRYVVGQGWRR
jgi:hypothetical protein